MPFSKEEIKILEECKNNFPAFIHKIGKLSFDNFIAGEHVDEFARLISQFPNTIVLSFRGSMKSVMHYLYIMWKLLYLGAIQPLEIYYFSYNEKLSGIHVHKIKEMIEKNPFFRDIIDLKPLAEVVAAYTWDKKNETRIIPLGVKGFGRGIHGNLLICDDILSDPENPITLTDIKKVNEIFASVILQCTKPGGEIKVAGTPMSRLDFYYDPDIRKGFEFREFPAIIDEGLPGKERSRWPEMFSLEQLKKKKAEIGLKRFNREFQITPFFSEEAYFPKEYLRKQVVNPNLSNLDINFPYKTMNTVIAGFDVGLKEHPSHLSVFEKKGEKWQMIHQKFLRTETGKLAGRIWPYTSGKDEYDPFKPTQLEYVKLAIKNFNIDRVYYDATRGELEGFRDQGLIPPQMIPVVFTHKLKVETASILDKMILNKELELINDERLLNSISSMTNDLFPMETPDGGHSDAFVSLQLCALGFKTFGVSTGSGIEITSGARSLFEEGQKPPRGW